jgi:hypothetical protein
MNKILLLALWLVGCDLASVSYDAVVNQVVLLKAPAAGAKIKVCFEV